MKSWRVGSVLAAALAACAPVNTPPAVPPPVTVPRTQPSPRPAERPVPRTVLPVRSFEEVRGLWVVRSTMTSEEEIRTMVADAADAGFNTLIVQVRGRGDAFYRSSLEPRAETITDPDGFDPLALAVREAHLRGMAVHAWVNTHLVWGSGALPLSESHIVHAHPEWLAVPRHLARELFEVHPREPRYVDALRRHAADNAQTVEGMFTSPSHPEVRRRILDVWLDLVDRYDLDGLHFDYIRYPSPDFDYSRSALEAFRDWVVPRVSPTWLAHLERAAEQDPLTYTTGLPQEWDDFRRTQITGLVREIYHAVKARRPELVVSAAVIANAETAYDLRFQDWRSWLAEGILDIAVPMAYTPDDATFIALVRSAREAAGGRGRVWAGIGAYLNTVDGTLDKIDLARREDAGGVVLFSYDWAVTASDPFLERVGRERFGS